MLFWSRIDLVFCDLFILICPLKSPQCTFRLEQRDEKWGWKYCMETERHAKRCSKTENTAPSYIWKISHGTELAIAPKFYAGRPTGWSATCIYFDKVCRISDSRCMHALLFSTPFATANNTPPRSLSARPPVAWAEADLPSASPACGRLEVWWPDRTHRLRGKKPRLRSW